MERSITYCIEPLQIAWYVAEKEFKETYPDLPQPFLTCTYRSPEEQTCLYNQPFDHKDNDGDGLIDEPDEKVTNAKAMQSYHNFKPSKAFDIAFKDNAGKIDWNMDLFKKFAVIMKKINIEISWGGTWRFKDNPHFQIE